MNQLTFDFDAPKEPPLSLWQGPLLDETDYEQRDRQYDALRRLEAKWAKRREARDEL